MNVLILGGTGAMGVYLVAQTAPYAKRVVVTSRSRSGVEGNVEYLIGNARDEVFLKRLLSRRWDAIIDFMVYSTLAFKERYRLFLNSTGHYIFLSSSRVYAKAEKALTEDSPRLLDASSDKDYLATDDYALSKARQENILFDTPQKNWSIIRPYITYSNERLQLGVLEKEDWLYRALKQRTIIASREINTKQTTLTYGGDVASGINALLGQFSAHGEAFHITSSYTIEWNEVLNTYLDVLRAHLGYRPKVAMQELGLFMQWRKSPYQIIYDRLYQRQFDNGKISKFINTEDFVQPREGLSRCLNSFINSSIRQFKPLNWREEALKDRHLGEYTPLSDIAGLKQKVKYGFFRYAFFLNKL